MLSNSIAGYREIIHERKGQSMEQTSLLFETAISTPAFSNHHLDQSAQSTLRQDPPAARRLQLAKDSDDD